MGYFFKNKNKTGFSIAEVMIGIVIVGMVLVVVATLSQQVSLFSKNARQSAAIMEIRGRTSSFNRDPAPWLSKLRGTYLEYSDCIPATTTSATVFNCPPVDPALQTELLGTAAGYHISSLPIVDDMGNLIAGTVNSPLYLSNDGIACTESDTSRCPLLSTGFFLRTNSATNATPGNVKFVIKISKNENHNQTVTGAMKPHFITMDAGSAWGASVGSCAAGSLNMGTLANGQPYCVSIAGSCPAGEVALGVDSSGSPVCQAIPSCASGENVTLGANQQLVCSNSNNPCASGQAFLGNFTGAGQAICSAGNSCSSGQVQIGFIANGNTLTPNCETIPAGGCSGQNILFNGDQFVCASTANNKQGCSNPNEAVVGVQTNGDLICREIASVDGNDGEDGVDGTDGNSPTFPVCAPGEFLRTNAKGKLVCANPLPECAPGQSIVVNANGNYACKSCPEGETLIANNEGKFVCKAADNYDDLFGAELIWDGDLQGGSYLTGNSNLIAGKKFSDYQFIFMMGHRSDIPLNEIKGAGMNFIPVKLFKNMDKRYFGYQTFSGDDTGYAFISYKDENTFNYIIYRGGATLSKIYGIGKKP